MYRNYKVVANTAVGRRRYLKYLLPQVLVSDIVDQYDLWVNTLDKIDIAFFEEMAAIYPKLNLIWQPEGVINGIYSMAAFYPYCQEEDTIYIKLDDDVIWFDPSFFEEICRFRIDNPQYFLVSPLVINNGICNYILQNKGLIDFTENIPCQPYDMRYYNGYLAYQLHEWFLNNCLRKEAYDSLYCGEQTIALQRFAINAVAWFGRDFKKFNGKVEGDDEEFLTVNYPAKYNKVSCFDCNTIVSHFSFSVQREYLDKTDILLQYEEILKKYGSDSLLEILKETDEALRRVENRRKEILKRAVPHGYKSIKKTSVFKLKGNIIEFVAKCFFVPKAHRKVFIRLYLDLVKSNRTYIKKLYK